MDFKSLAKQFASSDVLDVLAKSVGGESDKVEKAAAIGLPTIMEALNRNTNDKSGAESLAKALESHKGVDMDDLAGLLKNVDMKDGKKIIGHIFGGNTDNVTKSLSKKTGLDAGQISKLLVQFAPVILDFLGNKKEEEGLDANGVSGLTSTLSGLFGGGGSSGGAGGLLSIASGLLDGNDDDDDDGGGLLGSLGGLFG